MRRSTAQAGLVLGTWVLGLGPVRSNSTAAVSPSPESSGGAQLLLLSTLAGPGKLAGKLHSHELTLLLGSKAGMHSIIGSHV
jgi:hypothetical protein